RCRPSGGPARARSPGDGAGGHRPPLHVGGVLRRRRATMARPAPGIKQRPPRPRPGRGGGASAPRRVAAVLLVASAVALAWAPMNPAWVERVYSRGWYPVLQPIVTSLSSLVPVALLDIWIVLALLAFAWAGWRVVRAP